MSDEFPDFLYLWLIGQIVFVNLVHGDTGWAAAWFLYFVIGLYMRVSDGKPSRKDP